MTRDEGADGHDAAQDGGFVERWTAATVLLVPEAGDPLTAVDLLDLVANADDGDPSVVVVPVGRLPSAFFYLQSGVAGETVQKLANYHVRLAVVGELPRVARDSRAFSAWIREGERGRQAWFAPSVEALRSTLDRPRANRRPDHVRIEPDRS